MRAVKKWEQSSILKSLFLYMYGMQTSIFPSCLTVSTFQGEPGLDGGSVGYGFAFVDCAALRFWIGSIVDDASCAALGALLVQVESVCVNHFSPVIFLFLIWYCSQIQMDYMNLISGST